MNALKIAFLGICVTSLSGCVQTHNSQPSVTYSNSVLSTEDVPDIEENTPVAKAIEFMESSNPELITEDATDNEINIRNTNKPRIVSYHTNSPITASIESTQTTPVEEHVIGTDAAVQTPYFFPKQINTPYGGVKKTVIVQHKTLPKPQPKASSPTSDPNSAFSFVD